MKIHRSTRRGMRGVGIGLILAGIALLGFMAAAISASNQAASSLTGQQANKTQAAAITTLGTNVTTGMNAMITRGYTMTDVTFKGADGYGASDATETDKQIFHPTSGAASAPQTQPTAQDSPGASDLWRFWTTNFKITSAGATELGTSANDGVAILPKLKLGICQAINNQLYGDPVSTTPLSSNLTLANIQQTAPGGALTMYTVGGTSTPRTEGCLATTDSAYFYYKVLMTQ